MVICLAGSVAKLMKQDEVLQLELRNGVHKYKTYFQAVRIIYNPGGVSMTILDNKLIGHIEDIDVPTKSRSKTDLQYGYLNMLLTTNIIGGGYF